MIKLFSVLLVLFSSICFATTVDLGGTFCNQQTVDINRFTLLLSNHLLFDHLDKAYTQLSKKISYQFRDAIQVKVKKMKSTSITSTVESKQSVLIPPVDVQILKRQLKGAVGSFVEDKLPAILSNRYNTTILQTQLDHLLYQYCPSKMTQGIVSQQCLLDNLESFLTEIQRYTSQEFQSTLIQINESDLPRLFEKTRAQIAGILVHFNRHTMDNNYHRLELKIKSTHKTRKYWITPDMVQDFINTINHKDNEEETNIRHFLKLST
ncbi:hypothetical protein MFLAVUS_009679 [Mucor flavus]|uniref:Uncharacterized protein n=1 Tax=Mucor flavus TaxID=439312 RepID=A0ABP9ZAK4_9FUNG